MRSSVVLATALALVGGLLNGCGSSRSPLRPDAGQTMPGSSGSSSGLTSSSGTTSTGMTSRGSGSGATSSSSVEPCADRPRKIQWPPSFRVIRSPVPRFSPRRARYGISAITTRRSSSARWPRTTNTARPTPRSTDTSFTRTTRSSTFRRWRGSSSEASGDQPGLVTDFSLASQPAPARRLHEPVREPSHADRCANVEQGAKFDALRAMRRSRGQQQK